MARTKKPNYDTRIVLPTEPSAYTGWKKEGVVLKTMYHHYGLPGRIGEVVQVDPDVFDELVKKGFLKEI
jgi:hypothetical protein